jgi:parallel beta-helix repeat protein
MRHLLLASFACTAALAASCSSGTSTHATSSGTGGASTGGAAGTGGDTRSDAGTGGSTGSTTSSDGGPVETKCDDTTFEFPARSGLCVPDPCQPDPCGGKGSCSNLTGASVCTACTRFVDATGGLDTNAGTSSSAPWKTLAAVNAAPLAAGDDVCFKRGEVFSGALTVGKSGAVGNPIRFASYGAGKKPVLTGFSTLRGWTATTAGIWKAPCPSCGARVAAVIIDGANTAMGRTPNLGDANGGYLSYEATIGTPNADSGGYYATPYTGVLGIVDQQLPASPSWTGAEVVIRKIHYVLDRERVTSHTGTNVVYQNPLVSGGYLGVPGWGYFFQDSLQTLDQPGEWYFDPAAKELHVFFGAAGPGSSVVEASSVDTLVTVHGHDHVAFDGLALRGANARGFLVDTATDVTIRSADILFSGATALYASGTDGLTLESSLLQDSNNTGVYVRASRNAVVRSNVVRRTGVLRGGGAAHAEDGNHTGIMIGGIGVTDINTLVEGNLVEDVGYNGIHFVASGVTLKNNVIQRYNLLLDDGGGIYTWRSGQTYVNRKIVGNIVLDGRGAPDGQPTPATLLSSGIYLDNASNDVEVTDNTVAGAANAGLFENYATDIKISGNTLFDNTYQVSLASLAAQPITSNAFSGNLLFARDESQLCLLIASTAGQVPSFGTFDDNFHVRPTPDDRVIRVQTNPAGTSRFYGLAGWQAQYGWDQGGGKTPLVYLPYAITSQGPNLVPTGDFEAGIGGFIAWTSDGSATAKADATGKLGSPGSLSLTFASAADTSVLVYGAASFGAVSSGKSYLIRFNTLGSTELGVLSATLRQTKSPYANLAPPASRTFGTTKVSHEILVTAPTSDPSATFVIAISERSGTTYLDDLQVFEVSAAPVDVDANLRFEINPHSVAKTISLDAAYVDGKNHPYTGTLTLAPYTSAVLLKTP